MGAQSPHIGRVIAGGVISFSLMAGALAVPGGSAAQTAIVAADAQANLSSHDAAVDATRRGDYIAAFDFAKKAAAEGHPLDADQLDYITQKAARQQAQKDAEAKAKADSAAAAATAQQILERQQKDYAKREQQAKQAAGGGPNAAQLGQQSEGLNNVTGRSP